MPDTVDDILSELENTFIVTPSMRCSVQPSDGEIVTLDETIRNASPVLREHRADDGSCLVLNVSSTALVTMLESHTCGTFPRDPSELWNVLAAACELQLRELIGSCAESFLGMKKFIEVDYPVEWSTRTVMSCLETLVRGPLRTTDMYKQQMTRIAKHCNHNKDVLTNAMNLIRERIEPFRRMQLEGIPFNFDTNTVPIVIHRHEGRLRTAVIDGNQLKPVDVLGENFVIGALSVADNFYIKYACYVLFRSFGDCCVYRKNLQDGTDPIKILTACRDLLTRGNDVFAVCFETIHQVVLRWVNDETFVQIYKTEKQMGAIDFEPKTRLLAIQNFSDLLLFRLTEDNKLMLLATKNITGLFTLQLSESRIFLIVREVEFRRAPYRAGFACYLDTYQTPKANNSLVLESRNDLVREITIRKCGDVCFVVEPGTLQIVDNLFSLRLKGVISKDGEHLALSELSLSP